MAYDTEVDRMLADPRLSAAMDDFVARVKAGQPVRWHRLIHDTLHTQMHASCHLAMVTEAKWRLDQAGIPTTIVSEWVNWGPTEKGTRDAH